jgi:hypothetical protein
MRRIATFALVLNALTAIACEGAAFRPEPGPNSETAAEQDASPDRSAPAAGASDAVAPEHKTVQASRRTEAETGVTLWDITQHDAQYLVTGLSAAAEPLAAFRVDATARSACEGGIEQLSGRTAVVATRIDRDFGVQELDCLGSVTRSTFSAQTEAVWSALSRDATAALPNMGPSTSMSDFYCPQAFCGCELKTEVKCYGIIEICINHNGNCTTSKPYLCGACFGFSW